MEQNRWLSCRPIAHRGLYNESDGRAENSLAAFQYALELGVPFELDVQLTSDRRPVVVHDKKLSRIAGDDGLVSNYSWAELSRIRVTSTGQPIPTLNQVLELINGGVPIIVDVRRWGPSLDAQLEKMVADHIRGYDGPLALQSFDPLAVLRLRRLLPDRPVGQISGALHSAGPLLRPIGKTMVTNFLTRPDFVSFELSQLPSSFARYWRGRSGSLLAFTAYCEEDEHLALELADSFFFSGYLPQIYRGPGT